MQDDLHTQDFMEGILDLGDPRSFRVNLPLISVETIVPLIKLLHCLDCWALIFDSKCCTFYNLRCLNVNITSEFVGQSLSEVNYQYIMCKYRIRRFLVLVNLSSTQLITDGYREAFLISALQTHAEKGTFNNCFDLRLNTDNHWCAYIKQRHNSPVLKPTTNLKITGTKCLPDRPSHHTTPVSDAVAEAEGIDISDILGKKRNPNLNNVFPFDSFNYEKPVFSARVGLDENLKYSTQASDAPSVDCFHSSISPSLPLVRGPPDSKSQLVTNLTTFNKNASIPQNQTVGATSGLDDGHSYVTTRRENVNSDQRNGAQSNTVLRRSVQPPRHPHFKSFEARIESFFDHGWNELDKPQAECLVDSGLFATGRGDLVRCYQCGLGLKDWIKSDDPVTEHVKYSTQCEFLEEKLGFDKLRRMKDAVSCLPTNGGLSPPDPGQQSSSTTRNGNLPYPVRHPRYMTVDERLATFATFPRKVTQSHGALALAGLFFTGDGDICRCFTCDGGLASWVPGDDPMEEHAKYFPQCPYLRQIKGDNFVKLVQQRHNAENGLVENPVQTPLSQPEQSQVQEPTPTQAFGHLSISATADQETADIFRTTTGSSLLQMGYSKDVVRRAVKQLVSKGVKDPSAQQIVELILDYEDNGEQPSISGSQMEPQEPENGDQAVVTENEMLKASMLCILCKTRERNILCIPCSHHKMCTECAKDVTNCPSCGRDISTKIRTYMS